VDPAARVEAFETVRDRPYTLRAGDDESCLPKCDALADRLEDGGLDVRYRGCTFRWDDDDLPLPDRVLDHDHADPSEHVFLEVDIPERDGWATVDPSWDAGLAPSFEVPEWDGGGDTRVAVPVEDRLSIKETNELLTAVRAGRADEEADHPYAGFYRTFNNFLDKVRDRDRSTAEGYSM